MCVCVCVYVFLKCVGVLVMCTLTEVFLNLTEVFLTVTEVFRRFFLRCKANVRVKLAKTGHGPYSSTLVVICVVLLLFVLFYVLFVYKCALPPGDNPNAVNKHIISYQVIMKFDYMLLNNDITKINLKLRTRGTKQGIERRMNFW